MSEVGGIIIQVEECSKHYVLIYRTPDECFYEYTARKDEVLDAELLKRSVGHRITFAAKECCGSVVYMSISFAPAPE
ncbi:MAG: hypothetical protein SFW62_03980, partial [Alphaproteobacteria bacterium]|nr:hypothetical protein [Alphaproteobacteria bacterium]